jgi:hypothetical protein
MTPEFYVTIVNPDAKLFKHLYELDIIEKRGREEFNYRIFWPGDSLKTVKAQTKVWAAKERVEVLSITERYVKPNLQQDISSNSKNL